MTNRHPGTHRSPKTHAFAELLIDSGGTGRFALLVGMLREASVRVLPKIRPEPEPQSERT